MIVQQGMDMGPISIVYQDTWSTGQWAKDWLNWGVSPSPTLSPGDRVNADAGRRFASSMQSTLMVPRPEHS